MHSCTIFVIPIFSRCFYKNCPTLPWLLFSKTIEINEILQKIIHSQAKKIDTLEDLDCLESMAKEIQSHTSCILEFLIHGIAFSLIREYRDLCGLQRVPRFIQSFNAWMLILFAGNFWRFQKFFHLYSSKWIANNYIFCSFFFPFFSALGMVSWFVSLTTLKIPLITVQNQQHHLFGQREVFTPFSQYCDEYCLNEDDCFSLQIWILRPVTALSLTVERDVKITFTIEFWNVRRRLSRFLGYICEERSFVLFYRWFAGFRYRNFDCFRRLFKWPEN